MNVYFLIDGKKIKAARGTEATTAGEEASRHYAFSALTGPRTHLHGARQSPARYAYFACGSRTSSRSNCSMVVLISAIPSPTNWRRRSTSISNNPCARNSLRP